MIGLPAHLHARGTTLVLSSPAPPAQPLGCRTRMGWTVPWYADREVAFTTDMGDLDTFAVNVFPRVGARVYRTYQTGRRGGEQLLDTLRYLDLTPLGRREAWEESGPGHDGPSRWWRVHDEYGG